jgi:hypothetical protein
MCEGGHVRGNPILVELYFPFSRFKKLILVPIWMDPVRRMVKLSSSKFKVESNFNGKK